MRLYPGAVIRQAREERQWSQEGLCSGICAVSYLSKIEQGKAEASPELLRLLFARLELAWYDDEATLSWAKELTERFYEAVFSYDAATLSACEAELSAQTEHLTHCVYAPDAALMRAFLQKDAALAERFEPYFDNKRLALLRLLQSRDEEAMRLYPCAYLSLMAGIGAYERGGSYTHAVELLRSSYEQAAANGEARLMLLAQMYMGNCYCNQRNMEEMNAHYRIAIRLARALGDTESVTDMRYNAASAQLETGQYDEAYRYFSALEAHTVMSLHKLAVCCEKLGKSEEALAALDRAKNMPSEYPPTELAQRMCALVRFRLEHKDYLRLAEYGEMLLAVFAECRRSLPIGYASFHLPWVLEWYTASRQYRLAYELIRDFPIKI
ncbi:MAG: helix-turn-helix domain-containing protein [Faecousia sp.]